MAASVRQVCHYDSAPLNSNNINNITASFPAATLAGSTILVFVTLPDDVNHPVINQVIDSVNGSYGSRIARAFDTGNQYCDAYVFVNAASISSSQTVECDCNKAADYYAFVAVEINDPNGVVNLITVSNQVQTTTGSTTDNVQSSSLAGGSVAGLVVAMSSSDTAAHSPNAPAAGTGYTSGGTGWVSGTFWTWDLGQDQGRLEYQHFASIGTLTNGATWTSSGADTFLNLAVAFQDAAGSDTLMGQICH